MSEWNAAERTAPDALSGGFLARLVRAITRRRPGSDPTLGPLAFSSFACISEAILIACLGYAIAWAYVGDRAEVFAEYTLPIPLLALASIAIFQALSLYDPVRLRRSASALSRLALGWTGVFLLAFAVIFFLKLEGLFSRVVFGSWYLSGLALIVLGRILLARLGRALAAYGLFRRRAVLVGGGKEGEAFVAALRHDPDHDLELVGFVDDRDETRAPLELAGLRKLGTVESLATLVRRMPVDLAIFTLPVHAETRLLSMLSALNVLPIDIRLAAHAQKLRFTPRHYLYFGAVPAFAVLDRPVSGWANLQKALFDRLVGGLLLFAFSPLMLLIALAVRLDSPGPALFRQKRFGFNNEPIDVFKFRSMYVDQSDFDATKLATRDDPRITKLGRILRKTSLDELPQLINVAIYGNLSLVGPRPHAFKAKAGNQLYEDVIHGYFARHRVKPGMTGWAQINGWRGETDTAEKLQRRVEHDLHYIENWSLGFDLSILAMTPLALLRGENAY
jgi:Undecaprenyl-phosphate glucose phosphotransferase